MSLKQNTIEYLDSFTKSRWLKWTQTWLFDKNDFWNPNWPKSLEFKFLVWMAFLPSAMNREFSFCEVI